MKIKSIRKLLLVAFATLILSVASGSVYACMDYMGNLPDGSPVFFSCGSSAGNYAMWCDTSTNECFIDNDPEVQMDVDIYCMLPNSCNHRDDPITVDPIIH